MATYFIDLDGVLFQRGTMRPIQNVVDQLRTIRQEGHQIILTTLRKPGRNDPPELTIEITEKALKEQDIPYDHIVHSCSSPRVVINDEGAFSINHPTDHPWKQSYITLTPTQREPKIAQRLQASFEAIAWTNWRFGEIANNPEDCDDYVQTMDIAKSLILSGGFQHEDVIRMLTSDPGYVINGWTVPPSGRYVSQHSQSAKLFRSREYSFYATDGVTDGAAMRVTALAGWYGDNLDNLVEITNRCSRITHASLEARLAAILVALRIRQLLFRPKACSIPQLLHEFETAKHLLGVQKSADFFTERLYSAALIGMKQLDQETCLSRLASDIGLTQLAWTTPITATIWSFNDDLAPDRIMENQHNILNALTLRPPSKASIEITEDTYKPVCYEADLQHVSEIDPGNSYLNKRGDILRKLDIDTLLSITFSLIALKGDSQQLPPPQQVVQAVNVFGDDLAYISRQIASRRGIYK